MVSKHKPPPQCQQNKGVSHQFQEEGWNAHSSVCITGAEVDMVTNLKFPGVNITNNLSGPTILTLYPRKNTNPCVLLEDQGNALVTTLPKTARNHRDL